MNYEEIYTTHHDRVFGTCYAILQNREDAEDVVQMTFLKAWQHWHEARKPDIYWLLGIARHSALDYIKSKKIKNRTCERLPFNYDPPVDIWNTVDALIDLNSNMVSLTQRQKKILYAILLFGEDWQAVQKMLGVRTGSCYGLLKQARTSLLKKERR